MHVHITSGDGEAKFWLKPNIELAKNHGYSSKQLRKVDTFIAEHYDELSNAWHKHFSC